MALLLAAVSTFTHSQAAAARLPDRHDMSIHENGSIATEPFMRRNNQCGPDVACFAEGTLSLSSVSMEVSEITRVLSALAQPTRLSVVSLLAEAGERGINAGELAAATGTPANTMSAHLAVLSKAGLVLQEKTGRNVIFRVAPARLASLSAHFAHLAAGVRTPA